ncbi:MAG: hypothetical protein LBV74_00595 [Tannerella sp.]|jgi:hypothetical protein|nr:hypothetical protein [Tannerella sp.]
MKEIHIIENTTYTDSFIDIIKQLNKESLRFDSALSEWNKKTYWDDDDFNQIEQIKKEVVL